MTAHATALAVTKDERWAISPDETTQVAKALVEVEKHFPAKVVDPKWIAIGNLVMVVGMVYGTRIVSAMMDAQAARKAAPPRAGLASPPSPPPPSDRPGPHPATVHNRAGEPAGQTTYNKVPDTLVDMDAYAAAMAAVNNAPRAPG